MKSQRFLVAAIVASLVATPLLAGCAGTTYDPASAPATAVSTTTTAVPSGSIDELLPRLLDEAASLSTVLDKRGDAAEVGQRIQALWNVIRPEMDATNPKMVGSFEAALALSMRAVNKGRRADADKAAKNLKLLIDHYETS